ncbi:MULTISPECIES: SDR family NAD(P)-dependent oxidoreductase [unclassified Streptomyces]|uniref:SDR family NAD(P)-dependent oxidoreductase n=1 Tax=unclassified Streptomyces TaxID=2593676 RepID=UPI00352EBA62
MEADGGRALVIHADLTQPTAAANCRRRRRGPDVRELGRIDILVNNAGFLNCGSLHDVAVDELDRVLAVDVRSVFLAAQAAARHMSDGGRIISIGRASTHASPARTSSSRPWPRPRSLC